jgi:outer membrane lipoprotein-sorting protein
MRFSRYSPLALFLLLAVIAGCAQQRPPLEMGEKIALPQVLQQTLGHYEGINTMQAQLFIQLELRDEYYVLRGVLLYEKPARVHLQLSSSLGNTVGEVIYNDGLLSILLPSKERIYQGRIEEEEGKAGDALFLTMIYNDYEEREGTRFPTRIYGEGEEMAIRFNVKLKDPQVGIALPEDAFIAPTAGWEVHPLSELKGLFPSIEGKEGS